MSDAAMIGDVAAHVTPAVGDGEPDRRQRTGVSGPV
jgi:hypothetical protein